jgi:hypothetical protein
MNEVKAADVVATRKALVEQKKESLLLPRLSPTARVIFQTVLTTTWIEACWEEEILTQGAAVLYPDDPHPLRRLAHMIATDTLGGIYKLFLRIPSPAFIIHRAPMLWSLMSKKGKISAEMTGPAQGIMTLHRFPDLPDYQLEYIAGWLEQLFELMGFTRVRVAYFADNPDAWRWELSWE